MDTRNGEGKSDILRFKHTGQGGGNGYAQTQGTSALADRRELLLTVCSSEETSGRSSRMGLCKPVLHLHQKRHEVLQQRPDGLDPRRFSGRPDQAERPGRRSASERSGRSDGCHGADDGSPHNHREGQGSQHPADILQPGALKRRHHDLRQGLLFGVFAVRWRRQAGRNGYCCGKGESQYRQEQGWEDPVLHREGNERPSRRGALLAGEYRSPQERNEYRHSSWSTFSLETGQPLRQRTSWTPGLAATATRWRW